MSIAPTGSTGSTGSTVSTGGGVDSDLSNPALAPGEVSSPGASIIKRGWAWKVDDVGGQLVKVVVVELVLVVAKANIFSGEMARFFVLFTLDVLPH